MPHTHTPTLFPILIEPHPANHGTCMTDLIGRCMSYLLLIGSHFLSDRLRRGSQNGNGHGMPRLHATGTVAGQILGRPNHFFSRINFARELYLSHSYHQIIKYLQYDVSTSMHWSHRASLFRSASIAGGGLTQSHIGRLKYVLAHVVKYRSTIQITSKIIARTQSSLETPLGKFMAGRHQEKFSSGRQWPTIGDCSTREPSRESRKKIQEGRERQKTPIPPKYCKDSFITILE